MVVMAKMQNLYYGKKYNFNIDKYKKCQCIFNTLTFFISLVKSEIVVFIKKVL